MTSTDNRRILLPPYTEEDVVSILEDWGRTYAPSRFMVYGVEDDPAIGHDGDILAWGLASDDHVYVHALDSTGGGTFASVDSMRRIMFRPDRDIRVLWIDPQPEN